MVLVGMLFGVPDVYWRLVLHNRLGIALGRGGRLREALAEFQEALRLNPAHPSARQNAERALQMLGRN